MFCLISIYFEKTVWLAQIVDGRLSISEKFYVTFFTRRDSSQTQDKTYLLFSISGAVDQILWNISHEKISAS